MVDLTKYGHDLDVDSVSEGGGGSKLTPGRYNMTFCGDEIIVNTGGTSWEADMYLIADAPLLLAEVKRLRDRNKVLQDALDEVVQLSYNNYHNVLKTVHLSQPPED